MDERPPLILICNGVEYQRISPPPGPEPARGIEVVPAANTTPIILVCGSRGFSNRDLVFEVVAEFDPLTTVIEGGAPGPDLWARYAAETRGLHVAEVRALWKRYGNAAGHKRNAAMRALRPHHVCAFWDGKSSGTRGMISLAFGADIPVTVYREDGSHWLVLDDLAG